MNNEYHPVLVGQKDEIEIYIEYSEYLRIIKFAKAGASDGARGVLIGRTIGNKTYIFRVLEAVYCGFEGIESPSFTNESWGRIIAEIKESYPDYTLLGQFSAHTSLTPDRIDYIMQEKYFGKKSNLLFIFDPANDVEKFYLYKSREFEFLNGFFIFDKFGHPIDLSLRGALVRPLSREYELRMRFFNDFKNKLKKLNCLYFVTAIVFLLLIIFNLFQLHRIEKIIDEKNFSLTEIDEWKIE